MLKKLLSLALLCMLACGCTSVSYTDNYSFPKVERIDAKKNNTRQILISNYGYYLFNWIPLGSGSDSNNSFALFSDNVNLEAAMGVLKSECQNQNISEIADLQVRENSTCFFGWSPILGSTFGLYWYREMQLSAAVSSNSADSQKIPLLNKSENN